MKNQILKSIVVFLFSVLMTIGIYAQPQCRGHRQPAKLQQVHNQQAHQNFLDLTDDQRTEMNALRLAHHQAVRPLKNQMVELKARERSLLSEEEVDMKAINGNIDEQTALINQIKKLQAEQKVKFRAMLTDEQKMKMDLRRRMIPKRKIRRTGFHARDRI